jgi:ferrochelatase
MTRPRVDKRFSPSEPTARTTGYDAILIVGFGGPERREDVLPFLENVTRGRNVPRERLLEVARHYDHFDGISPINAQVRALIAALRAELDHHGITLPIFWGNRNWHPMLADVLVEMTAAGINQVLAVVLAAYSSYSSCRQYLEDIDRARAAVGPAAPWIDKVRVFYDHPGFIAANVERVRATLADTPPDRREMVHLAFTAHSIPLAMARNCSYEQQLRETCRLVAAEVGMEPMRWALVYQSRSGRTDDPWLEPDILDHIKDLHRRGVKHVLIHPIGFLSDHLEVLYDLDVAAQHRCDDLGLTMSRSQTVGTDVRFVGMLRELIEERIGTVPQLGRRLASSGGPRHEVCPATCCLPPGQLPAPPGAPLAPERTGN